MSKKQIETVASQQQSPFENVLKPLLAPSFFPVLAILAVAGIIALFGNKNRHGKLADARFASNGEINSAVKQAVGLVKNPSIESAAMFISEPIGGEIPTPENIDKFKGRLTPITDCTRGTVIIGNQGSGKTENIIDPAIKSVVRQGFGIIMMDVKFPAQTREILPFAVENGYSVRIFAPGSDVTGNCNILDAIDDEHDSTTADQVVFTIRSNLSGADDKRDAFFDGGGEAMIAGAMLLTKMIGRKTGRPEIANLLLVDEIINTPNLIDRLLINREEIPHAAYRSFSQYMNSRGGDDKNNTEASLQSTASNILKPLVSSKFIDCISGKPNFPCFDSNRPFWVGEKEIVIFGVSQDLRGVVLPLIVTVLEQVGRYNLSNSRLRKLPILIALDEFAAIKLPIVIDDWLPEKRSAGAMVLIGIQFVAQMTQFYGEEGLKKLLGCANKFFCGTGSLDNAEMLSKELGNKEVLIGSSSKSNTGGRNASSSNSESQQTQSVALSDPLSFKQLPIGTCFVDCVGTRSGNGINERVGFPYKRRFARLHQERQQQKERNTKIYDAIEKSIIEAKVASETLEEKIDLNARSIECRKLIDEYLPLGKPSTAKGEKKSKDKPAPEKYLLLKDLLAIANYYEWQLEGDLTDRQVPVPNDWSGDISTTQLVWALESVDIKILSKTGEVA
jgi:type IV secretory pathway TraG/TraD family ATPase VirD4